MSVCAKFQLPSMLRSGWKVPGGWGGVGWGGVVVNSHNRIKPNINCGCIELYWGCGWGFDNSNLGELNLSQPIPNLSLSIFLCQNLYVVPHVDGLCVYLFCMQQEISHYTKISSQLQERKIYNIFHAYIYWAVKSSVYIFKMFFSSF